MHKKSGWADSNRRPPVPQTDTLTTALHPETTYSCFFASLCQLDTDRREERKVIITFLLLFFIEDEEKIQQEVKS